VEVVAGIRYPGHGVDRPYVAGVFSSAVILLPALMVSGGPIARCARRGSGNWDGSLIDLYHPSRRERVSFFTAASFAQNTGLARRFGHALVSARDFWHHRFDFLEDL
jgi:hypothetical protein